MSVTSDSPSKVDSDETTDKLFICSSMGCNQKFESANNLAVHEQKHQMTLTLGPSKLTSIADVLPVDQTPTPTRFLRLGNQIGLFDELNPFDREFNCAQKDGISSKQRRAAAVVQQLQLQALNNKNRSPSTPTRSTTTTELNAFSVPGQPMHVIALTPTVPSPATAFAGGTGQFLVPPLLPSPQGLLPSLSCYNTNSPLQVPAHLLSPTLMPFPSGFMSASMVADAQQRAAAFTQAMFAAAASASSPLATNTPPFPSAPQQSDPIPAASQSSSTASETNVNPQHRTNSGPIPSLVITKEERPLSVSSVVSETSRSSDRANGTTQPHSGTTSSLDSYHQRSSDGMSSYPVVVQLPNGQTTCIGLSSNAGTMSTSSVVAAGPSSLPSVTSLSHPIMNTQTSGADHVALGPRASNEFGSTSSLLEAKQKLKKTLTNNNPNLQEEVAKQNSVPAHRTTTSGGEAKPVRRRGRQSLDVDPDIKRQRFLERNRAAASRCRSKKKVWVDGLEQKAKNLAHNNVAYQNEIAALKDEVATLKQLLLAHRDCPVTKMQQQSMALAGINMDFTSSSNLSIKPNLSHDADRVRQTLCNTLSNSSMDEHSRPNTQQSNSSSSTTNGPLYQNMAATNSS